MTFGHVELLSPEGGVILLLLLFSVLTWTLGVLKLLQYRRLQRRARQFRALFWQQDDLSHSLSHSLAETGAFANLAQAALQAPQPVNGKLTLGLHLPDRVERALQQQIQRERRTLETGLAVLASIGTTSPFIGLFGTVWGMTNAIPVQLPKTAAVAPAERTEPLVISIDAQQQMFINKDPFPRDRLAAHLQQAKANNANLVVQVQADKEANYGEVAALLADVEQAGITRLSLLTQK